MADEPETEVPRSIRLPQKLWDALEADAKRCKRSAVKQLEALLTKWFRLDDVEIHFDNSDIPDANLDNTPDSNQQSVQTARTPKGPKRI